MKTLKVWLDEERGRYTALALHLGVSTGRVSQMADHGVPPKFMLMVRDFTKNAVSLEALVSARTPGADVSNPSPDLPHATAAKKTPRAQRDDAREKARKSARRSDGKPSNRNGR